MGSNMQNLTILLAYILLAGWMGYIGAAVITHNIEAKTQKVQPVKLDPLGYKPNPVWV